MLVRVGFSRASLTGVKVSPDLNHPIRYTITDDRWVCETHTFRSETQWSKPLVVSHLDEGFMAIRHDHQIAWLPIHGLESEAAVETFVGMVKSHDVKYDDRRQTE